MSTMTPKLNLPKPNLQLPIAGGAHSRPSTEVIERLRQVSSATAVATLHKLGVTRTFVAGPVSRKPGARVVGPVVTLQFMPQREDIASGISQEYAERESALWHVLDAVSPGDILAIQAWGDIYSGCLGEMLITYFKGRGGAGIVVDGYIRDWPKVEPIGVPIWCRGLTPHYASQSGLYPWAYNTPIACGAVLALPGDIMIADDDGVVLVPIDMAEMVAEEAGAHESWEVFSRMRLAEGGSIWDYYPLSERGCAEYRAWEAAQNGGES